MDYTLVFPHQLFAEHPAIAPGRRVALIEDSLFFGDARYPAAFHKQKLVFHRASMRAYAAELAKRGSPPVYIDYRAGRKLADELADLGVVPGDTIHCVEPVDDVLGRRLKRFAEASGVTLRLYDSPMFLSTQDDNAEFFSGCKRRFMADYYKAQRKRLGVLVDAEGKPAGGQWSFDEDNRKPWPKRKPLPPDPAPTHSRVIDEALSYVSCHFPDNPGNVDGFWFAVDRAGALAWLDEFIARRFKEFGPYEDALCAEAVVLQHSVLTPYLNSGLLTPHEVVSRALDAGARLGVPMNSLEGFIRQVIGWREFMRAMYELHGVEQRNSNFWGCERPIPRAFYTASTGVPPLDAALRKVLDHAYCHHIERLMVIGNFALLCRIRPDDVYRWFLEMFIDAYDWVMVPNVYGMSQFADGGLFSSKPYISGSNYLRKMGDYPTGNWQAVWDGLFWSFIDDYQEFFRAHPRLGMMARQLDRMAPEKLAAHRRHAAKFLDALD